MVNKIKIQYKKSCKLIAKCKPAVKINMQSLQEDLDKNKDSYYFERAKRLNVSTSCVFYAMKRLGVSYKKNSTASKGRQGKTSHI